MLRMLLGAVVLALALASGASSLAQDDTNTAAPAANAAAPDTSWVDHIQRQSGVIQLPDAGAQLNLGDAYDFIPAADAKRLIVEVWQNTPDAADGVLGVIVPKGGDPRDNATWGAVVTFDDVGYVTDKDAGSTDYAKILDDMRQGESDANAERTKDNLPAMHLVGWATPPRYDAQNHVLIWARDLQVTGQTTDQLNYDIRVLGRKGVLSINVLASMSDLAAINAAAASIGATAQYLPGQRYADYDASQDKTAAYGIAGLIAAGGVAVAGKLGFFGVILLFLKKAFVLVAAVFAGGAAWLRRMFGGKSKKAQTPAGLTPQPPPPNVSSSSSTFGSSSSPFPPSPPPPPLPPVDL